MARSEVATLSVLLLGAPVPAQDAGAAVRPAPQEIPETVVTATTVEEDPLDLPFSIDVVGEERLRGRARTLPDALEGLPSVMVQRTGHGQASPFIRGFTGYSTLMLVDGVRLNHAAMRSGPNQYWSTVDSLSVDRLELVRGPSSVLYGSDAIGGTVNAVTRRAAPGAAGGALSVGGGVFGRYASAEDSWIGRAELEMTSGSDWGLLGGVSVKDFNDLEAGRDYGTLPYTAYEERDGDLRFDGYLANGMQLTFAWQTVRQQDVPRTHSTVFSVPFHGTVAGTELRRELDQIRDLVYGRLSWDEAGGLFHGGEITLSFQRHDEERDRLRTGGRRDLEGFSDSDLGLTARFQSEGLGLWSWGVEAHQETISSFRNDYVDGVLTQTQVQGPVGDDSEYTTLAAYVQNELDLERFRVIPGVRVTSIAVDAGRVQNPDPGGPRVIQIEDDWTAAVGSLRGLYHLGEASSVYAGVSQGFRAPSLADVSTFDETSAFEVPTTGLDPEYYVQVEAGYKGRMRGIEWQAAVYRTWIRDMIVQSPTGGFVGGTPVVEKSNVGDGWIHGIEGELRWPWNEVWSSYIFASWMDGEVEQLDLSVPGGQIVEAPVSRLMPAQATFALHWQPPASRQWVEGWVWAMDNQDDLALRDQVDTQRIPPTGTPGFYSVGITGGWDIRENLRATLTVENLTDMDYRVHGSGLNAPGRNVVATVEISF
ncbi:MAG: TonB-dependent receptor [Planctomycetota bacterium]|nr:MAG: TonB-dependent receptor [Planctomycetota bacterium]